MVHFYSYEGNFVYYGQEKLMYGSQYTTLHQQTATLCEALWSNAHTLGGGGELISEDQGRVLHGMSDDLHPGY